jgi:hypothetical protein
VGCAAAFWNYPATAVFIRSMNLFIGKSIVKLQLRPRWHELYRRCLEQRELNALQAAEWLEFKVMLFLRTRKSFPSQQDSARISRN